MSVDVVFQLPAGVGSVDNLAIGSAARYETVAAAATGSLTALDGEMAVLFNTSASDLVYVAHGPTPNAAATAATAATSARYPLPPRVLVPVAVKAGDKFAVVAAA